MFPWQLLPARQRLGPSLLLLLHFRWSRGYPSKQKAQFYFLALSQILRVTCAMDTGHFCGHAGDMWMRPSETICPLHRCGSSAETVLTHLFWLEGKQEWGCGQMFTQKYQLIMILSPVWLHCPCSLEDCPLSHSSPRKMPVVALVCPLLSAPCRTILLGGLSSMVGLTHSRLVSSCEIFSNESVIARMPSAGLVQSRRWCLSCTAWIKSTVYQTYKKLT